MTNLLNTVRDLIKSELHARFDDGHDVIFDAAGTTKSGKSTDRMFGEIITLNDILVKVDAMIATTKVSE